MCDKFFIDLSNMNDERNGKIIPAEVMLNALIKFRDEIAANNDRMYIEVSESNPTVDLSKIIGYLKNLDIDLTDGVKVNADVNIMNTPMGKLVKNVMDDNNELIGRIIPRGYIEYDENNNATPIITSFSLTSTSPNKK